MINYLLVQHSYWQNIIMCIFTHAQTHNYSWRKWSLSCLWGPSCRSAWYLELKKRVKQWNRAFPRDLLCSPPWVPFTSTSQQLMSLATNRPEVMDRRVEVTDASAVSVTCSPNQIISPYTPILFNTKKGHAVSPKGQGHLQQEDSLCSGSFLKQRFLFLPSRVYLGDSVVYCCGMCHMVNENFLTCLPLLVYLLFVRRQDSPASCSKHSQM